MWLTLANANAPQETWIADLYNAALKQSTEDERATAGDYLGRWMDGRRD
jgi:hypothetical protein